MLEVFAIHFSKRTFTNEENTFTNKENTFTNKENKCVHREQKYFIIVYDPKITHNTHNTFL